MKKVKVTWNNKISKVYEVPASTKAQESNMALDLFQKEFADKIPPYKPGTSAARYFGKFLIERI